MRNGRKAVIAGALCVLLAISAGCTKKEEKTSANENEFTYWCLIPGVSLSSMKDMNDMLMYQELEKETGVKIKFTHAVAGQHDEQFNLMIASGEYPDMIEYYWRSYAGGPDQAINDNIIIPLNDIIKEHAPNYYKALQENKDYNAQSLSNSGNYYAFSQLSDPENITGFVGIMLRGDWLEELGLSVPETIDEWETVLRAFKNEKGAATPLTGDLNIFATGAEGVNLFNSAYNVGKGFYVDGGKVKYGVLEPGYRKYIEKMRQWVTEGLIDPDYDTNSSQIIDSKMISGEAGATFGGIGGTMGKYLNAGVKLVAAPYPVMKKGDVSKINSISKLVDDPSIAITTSCEYPEKAAQWADFLYSEKGKYLKNFGVEGKTYTMVDGKPVYTDLILKNPDGLSISEAMGKYFRANSNGPGFGQETEYLDQYYQLNEQKEAFKIWKSNAVEAQKSALPPFMLSLDENTEKSNIMLDVDTYVNEMLLKFIKGTESMDKYDQFVETVKNMGIEKVIDIYQKATDAYYNR